MSCGTKTCTRAVFLLTVALEEERRRSEWHAVMVVGCCRVASFYVWSGCLSTRRWHEKQV